VLCYDKKKLFQIDLSINVGNQTRAGWLAGWLGEEKNFLK